MKKDNRVLLFYYLGLLLVMLSWTDANNAPNMVLRIAFMLAAAIPAFLFDKSFLAPVIICFGAITQNGFAHSYMPDNLWFYIALLTAGLLFFHPAKYHYKIPVYLWVLTLYVTFIDLMTSFTIEKITLSCLVSILFLFFTSKESSKDLKLWALCFIICSFSLALLFLMNRQRFAEAYYGQALERTQWMDPNYFGMVIGMGYVISLILLMKQRGNNEDRIYYYILRLLCIGTILVSSIVLVLNASRGALLAAGLATIVAVFMSKAKIGWKFLVIVLLLFGLVFLYNNSYFDLLEYRMENENTEGGNGRSYIWQTKLTKFFEGNPLNMIVGYGQEEGLKLGFTYRRGTHNDFISFLVEYGVIGFIMFIYMIFRPIGVAYKTKNAIPVFVLITYLATCCFTLEPISGAYIPYLFLYIYIVLIAYSNKRPFHFTSR